MLEELKGRTRDCEAIWQLAEDYCHCSQITITKSSARGARIGNSGTKEQEQEPSNRNWNLARRRVAASYNKEMQTQ